VYELGDKDPNYKRANPRCFTKAMPQPILPEVNFTVLSSEHFVWSVVGFNKKSILKTNIYL